MTECLTCGTATVPGEAFCSNCGTKNPPAAKSKESEETTLAYEDEAEAGGVATAVAPEAAKSSADSAGVELSGEASLSDLEPEVSLGGVSTGEVPVEDPVIKHTVKKGNTGGRQSTVKQLDPASVLNSRYEIVRRIGGGGMGAVYLAKDRNLGDAPRAVKEMVEAHLDPTQHEKAIGDFKRESLLLTSLEHPSIPTIYDYFYDESLGQTGRERRNGGGHDGLRPTGTFRRQG